MRVSTKAAEATDNLIDAFHRLMFRMGLRGGLTVTAHMT